MNWYWRTRSKQQSGWLILYWSNAGNYEDILQHQRLENTHLKRCLKVAHVAVTVQKGNVAMGKVREVSDKVNTSELQDNTLESTIILNCKNLVSSRAIANADHGIQEPKRL